MATTVSYVAKLSTRKNTATTNANNSAAMQAHYTDDSFNYVGIVCFPEMNLGGKVVTAITFKVTSASAGHSYEKKAFIRKSNYQSNAEAGVSGADYYGDLLGVLSGRFYGNTAEHVLADDMLQAVGSYIAQGNNTFCLFDEDLEDGGYNYAANYLRWTDCTITVTYEEGISLVTTSAPEVELGNSVEFFTNRLNENAIHTIRVRIGELDIMTIDEVEDMIGWVPEVSIAEHMPDTESTVAQVICETYYSGTMVGSSSAP